MQKPWLKVLLLMFSLILNACVSTGELSARKEPDVLQRRVQMWLGMPRDFLEKYWGVSKNTKDMGMGLRYLTYKSKGKAKSSCAVKFTIDITNTVKGGEWSGDRASCLRFVKEVPSLNQPQTLVYAFNHAR